MEVYIDRENLVSYVHSVRDDKFENCNILLNKCCDIKFTFSKEDLEVIKKDDEELNIWITKMTEDVKGSVKWGINFPPRPLKTNLCNDMSYKELTALYLINDDKIANVKERGCLIVGEPGKELEALSLLIINDDNPYSRVLNIRDLENWDFLDQYISPTTDVIIADRYLALDKTLYDNNLYALVKKLASKSKCKLNYIIFSDRQINVRGMSISPDWDKIIGNIKDNVCNVTGVKPNVTFVLKSRGEHDRTIFTNYKLFHSGDTFNYFASNWSHITRGRYLNIDSIASSDCYKMCLSFIEDMQGTIDKLDNPDYIKGDKKSFFLKFNT